MKRIAIAGNIASGKSEVQKILTEHGYKILDTDDVSHELLNINNPELYNSFKDYDVFENGEFSRKKLGKIIFSNPVLKNTLESIIHPQVEEHINKFFETNKNEDLVFAGIPLIFEAGMEHLFDNILFIYTDDNIRLERLVKRNNYDIEYAKIRINSQMPQDLKIKKSDYVIYNNGSKEDLKNNVMQALTFLRG